MSGYTPVVVISVTPDGEVRYEIRTTLLSTQSYGVILADLMYYVATMLATEGGFDFEQVQTEIMENFELTRRAQQVPRAPTSRVLQ